MAPPDVSSNAKMQPVADPAPGDTPRTDPMVAYRQWLHIPDTRVSRELGPDEQADFRTVLANIRNSMDRAHGHAGEQVEWFLAQNRSGAQAPIFWCFNNWAEPMLLARRLGPQRPLYAMGSLHQKIFRYGQKIIFNEPLAGAYADAIMRVTCPEETLVLGGNCQAGPIAEAVAHRLIEAGRQAPLLITLEYIPRRPYPGPLCLLFGGESRLYNPFLSPRNPVPVWNRQHANFTWGIVPGAHGGYFAGRAILHLEDYIRQAIAASDQSGRMPPGPLTMEAESRTVPPTPRAGLLSRLLPRWVKANSAA